MRVAIIGGTGFLGKNLTLHLLKKTEWDLTVVSHSSKTFDVPSRVSKRVCFIQGDVLEYKSIRKALNNIDTAYYFVHMMGQKNDDFYGSELKAAKIFKRAAESAGVKRIIYMGGLGSDEDALSEHLASRHRTGRILRSSKLEVIEFQASMIIGKGSVAFDTVVNLVARLPVMILPKSAKTRTQPIVLKDVLTYLLAAAQIKLKRNIIVQIGGPDVLTYEDLYRLCAAASSKQRAVIWSPFVSARLEALFLDKFIPKVHARIGKAMVESLGNEMIVTSQENLELFPAIKLSSAKAAIKDYYLNRPRA